MVLGDATVHDGALKLTTAKRWQTGSFVMRPGAHLRPLRTFDASFEVLIGGGRVETEGVETEEALFDMRHRGHEPLSGEGVCFAFGDIAQATSSGLTLAPTLTLTLTPFLILTSTLTPTLTLSLSLSLTLAQA